MRHNDRKPPPGQRSEVTGPTIPILGALVIVFMAVLLFSLWPDTGTVRTNAVSNAPHEDQKVPAQTPPPKPQ
jgi:hypothetical protein